MSEYWKSTPRHYCPTCKVWLSGHARNVTAHEQSEGHLIKKDIFLNQLAKKKREEETKERETLDTIKMIESAALNAMESNRATTTTSHNLTTSGFRATSPSSMIAPVGLERYMVCSPPANSLRTTIMRPIEERNIAKFIAEKLGRTESDDNDPLTTTSDDTMDYRKSELFYGEIELVPIQLRQNPAFNNPACWTAREDSATGLPLWTNQQLAISVWEEPPCLANPSPSLSLPDNPETLPGQKEQPPAETVQESAPHLRPAVAITAAGIPGAWEEVQPENSVLFSGSTGHGGFYKSEYESETQQVQDLSEILDDGASRGADRAQKLVGSALDQLDLNLAEQRLPYAKDRQHPASVADTKSAPDVAPKFRKRPLLNRLSGSKRAQVKTEDHTEQNEPESLNNLAGSIPSTDLTHNDNSAMRLDSSSYPKQGDQDPAELSSAVKRDVKADGDTDPVPPSLSGPISDSPISSEQPRSKIKLDFTR